MATPVVFVSAHPDDETFTFGPGIINHIKAGYDVHVALITRGGASSAISKVRDKLDYYITHEEFMSAREREFRLACSRMGVRSDNISVYELQDGHVTFADVANILRGYEARLPGANFKVHSPYDTHSDHATIGDAAKYLHERGTIKAPRYYLPLYMWDQKGGFYEDCPDEEAYRSAVNAFGIWNPPRYYSVGGLSVPDTIEARQTETRSKLHA